MKLLWFMLCLCIVPLSANAEKDNNLKLLKKAHGWLLEVSQEETGLEEEIAPVVDLSNTDSVWDRYKQLMKKSMVLIKKYPKKIADNLTETVFKNNPDIMPFIAFYIYANNRKDQQLRYYDAFNTTVREVTPDLWIALIPFQDSKSPILINYSVLILDLRNQRFLIKD